MDCGGWGGVGSKVQSEGIEESKRENATPTEPSKKDKRGQQEPESEKARETANTLAVFGY